MKYPRENTGFTNLVKKKFSNNLCCASPVLHKQNNEVLAINLLGILLSTSAFCQQADRINIQHVSIGDTVLIKEITSTISEEINGSGSEHIFKSGLEYIILNIN